MSNKLPVISYLTLAKKLENAGYKPVRASKHIIYCNEELNLTIPIPKKHKGDVPKGTLRTIVNMIKLSVKEFNDL